MEPGRAARAFRTHFQAKRDLEPVGPKGLLQAAHAVFAAVESKHPMLPLRNEHRGRGGIRGQGRRYHLFFSGLFGLRWQRRQRNTGRHRSR